MCVYPRYTYMYSYKYMCVYISPIRVFNYWTYSCIHFKLSRFGLDVHRIPVRNVQLIESAVHVVTLVTFRCH